MRHALTLVPADAGVSATYSLVPHLTHREHVYEFPNPWVPTNWGPSNRRPDPDTVDYLVLDTTLRTFQRGLYRELVRVGGPFEVVEERDGVVVARRVGPG
jgi:hypothetical protein